MKQSLQIPSFLEQFSTIALTESTATAGQVCTHWRECEGGRWSVTKPRGPATNSSFSTPNNTVYCCCTRHFSQWFWFENACWSSPPYSAVQNSRQIMLASFGLVTKRYHIIVTPKNPQNDRLYASAETKNTDVGDKRSFRTRTRSVLSWRWLSAWCHIPVWSSSFLESRSMCQCIIVTYFCHNSCCLSRVRSLSMCSPECRALWFQECNQYFVRQCTVRSDVFKVCWGLIMVTLLHCLLSVPVKEFWKL